MMNDIICGDCLEVMQTLPDNSFDLIVTSPPYNIRNSTGGGMRRATRYGMWVNNPLTSGYDGYGDDMPYDEYVEWQRKCLAEMLRLIPEDGAIFYNHKSRVQNGRWQDRRVITNGFPVRQVIIWWMGSGINFNPGYFVPTYEEIFLIAKPKFQLAPKANSYGDVWEIPRAQREKRNGHPAPFPLEIPQRIISSTNAKTVLDPFAGSGTTLVAAKRLNRDYIGIEINPKYCELIKERLDGVEGKTERKEYQMRLM